MSRDYIAIEEYIKNYEPHYKAEAEEQSAELGPWMEAREKDLGLAPVYDEAGHRIFQKGLVAWAFSR